MGEKVKRSQLARRWGVSTQRIDAMVAAGQLPVARNGLIDVEVAEGVRQMLDPARMEQAASAKMTKPAGQAAPDAGGEPAIYKARTAKAVQEARLAELRVKEMLGAVVDRDTVKAEAHAAGRVLVQRMQTIPARVAPMVAVETDERKCRAIVEQEIRQTIVEFQDLLAAI